MGDRGNIVLRYNSARGSAQDIYLYTHWRGSDIPAVVQNALKKRWRWDDNSYLGRIVFDELVQPHGEETSYGISPFVTDNQHDYIMIDLDAKKVQRVDPDSGTIKASWTYEEFCKLDLDTAAWLKDF